MDMHQAQFQGSQPSPLCLMQNQDSSKVSNHLSISKCHQITALPTHPSLISDLWQKLSALYGSAFTKPQGLEVDPTGVWSLTLSSLSGDDIDYGFKKLVLAEQFDVFPPNPKQFRALCLSRRNKKALPSVGEAFNEAKNYFRCGTRINHKAILFCALKIGETMSLSCPTTT